MSSNYWRLPLEVCFRGLWKLDFFSKIGRVQMNKTIWQYVFQENQRENWIMFQLKWLRSTAFLGCSVVFSESVFPCFFPTQLHKKSAKDTIHSRWPIFGLLDPGIGAFVFGHQRYQYHRYQFQCSWSFQKRIYIYIYRCRIYIICIYICICIYMIDFDCTHFLRFVTCADIVFLWFRCSAAMKMRLFSA